MLKRLLVVMDGQEGSAVAVRQALDLAQAFDSAVLFVGVVPSRPIFVADMPTASIFSVDALHRAAESRVRECIDDAMRDAARRGVRSAYQLPSEPMHAKDVVSLAVERACGAIVIASEGRTAIGRLLAGSLIPGLVTHAPMPVLICKAPRRMVRGRPATRATPTVDSIASLLRGPGAGITGAHVWSTS